MSESSPPFSKLVFQTFIDSCEKNKRYKTVAALFKDVAKLKEVKKHRLDFEDCLELGERLGCTCQTGEITLLNHSSVPSRGPAPVPVDPKELQREIDRVVETHDPKTPGALWRLVAESDWAKNHQPKPISSGIAANRAKKCHLSVPAFVSETTHRVEIDPEELQKTIDEVESSRQFTTMSALWQAVADSSWGRSHPSAPLSSHTIGERAREYELRVQTQPARRKSSKKGGQLKRVRQNDENALPIRLPPIEGTFVDPMKVENDGVPEIEGQVVIVIPGGTPEVELEDTDEDAVREWCEAVVDRWSERGKQLMPSGLAFFARQFYDVRSDEYRRVYAAIQSCKLSLYKNPHDES